jgi:predicted nucleic acid-binding protein
MVTYVLDASAILRLLDGEAGFQQVKLILQNADEGLCQAQISAVNWGEIIYTVTKRHGQLVARQIEQRLRRHAITIVAASESRAAHAGLIKLHFGIAYADAFGVELASDSSDHILVTADFGVKSAEHGVRIEFLPSKPIS